MIEFSVAADRREHAIAEIEPASFGAFDIA